MKKKCIIYGNFQHSLLEKYLALTNFVEEYDIVPTMDVYCKNKTNLDNKTLSSISLYLYQYVPDDFDSFFCTANIIGKLNKNCIKICIPNFYFTGYFPQIAKSRYTRVNKKYSFSPSGIMVYGDKNIEDLLILGKNYSEIVSIISQDGFYNNDKNSK